MYYLIYGLLYGISLLPMKVLYIISDGIYFLIYRVFGYRKKVVMSNLAIAFPEKSHPEKEKIARQFYKNFVDNFIEAIKLFSGGPKYGLKKIEFDNSMIEELYRKGKSCQVHLGHNFNWELANIAVPAFTSYPILAVYMPIENKALDKVFYKLRSSGGSIMIPATDIKNAMMPYRNSQYALALVADQVPGNPNRAYWLNFFGKPAPFARGPEKGARSADLAVIFSQIYKPRRGLYKMEFTLVTENAGELPEGELTRRYVDYLEKVIRDHPDVWLWSHRRWKREWKEEYREHWIGSELQVTK